MSTSENKILAEGKVTFLSFNFSLTIEEAF